MNIIHYQINIQPTEDLDFYTYCNCKICSPCFCVYKITGHFFSLLETLQFVQFPLPPPNNDVFVIWPSSQVILSCFVKGNFSGQLLAVVNLQLSWIAQTFFISMISLNCFIYLGMSYISMTSLLAHTVPHSTRHYFRPKTNNQPLKKFFNLAFSWVKIVKNWTSF